MSFRREFVVMSLALGAGCASRQIPHVDSPFTVMPYAPQGFPSREALAGLASPDARPTPPPDPAAVAWTLAGPLPETHGGVVSGDDDPVSMRLRDRVQQTGGRAVVTAQMQCAARESARYAAEHEGPLPAALRGFIASRCGALTEDLSVTVQPVTLRRATPEAQRAAEIARGLDAPIDAALRGLDGPIDVGVAALPRGNRAVVALAAVRRRVTLTRATPDLTDGGAVLLQGTTTEPVRAVDAWITRGADRAARCEADALATAPDFSLRCPLSDELARIDLVGRTEARDAPYALASLVVGPGRARALTFAPPPAPAAGEVAGVEASRESLFTRLDTARRAAGLSALTLSQQQSAAVCAVTPALDAAMAPGGDRARADAIARGVLAGWDVPGIVRHAELAFVAGAPSPGVEAWTQRFLASPAARATLLDPAARVAALCPHVRDGRIEAVVLATYRAFDRAEMTADTAAFYERLDAARAALHRGPVRREASLEATMRGLAAHFADGAIDARGTMRAMLDAATAQTRQPVTGWVIPVRDDAAPELPSELTNEDGVAAAAALAYHGAPGDAWGTQVFFVVRVGR